MKNNNGNLVAFFPCRWSKGRNPILPRMAGGFEIEVAYPPEDGEGDGYLPGGEEVELQPGECVRARGGIWQYTGGGEGGSGSVELELISLEGDGIWSPAR